MVKKNETGSSDIEAKFIISLNLNIVKGIIKAMIPGLCIGSIRPVFHRGVNNWKDGWWVGVQDGLFIKREGDKYNLYWEL